MRKALLIAAAALMLLSGCRPGVTEPEAGEAPATWADLFDAWWSGMNANYVFWSLDSPADEWDKVYDETMPRMEGYGGIGESYSSDRAALRDFSDIVKTLHDGHYVLRITNGQGLSGEFRPVYYRVMQKAGMTDDEIFEALISGDPENQSALFRQSDFHAENTASIMERTFGIAGISGSAGAYRGFGQANVRYFSQAGYLKTPSSLIIGDENAGDFMMLLGLTEDDILYLGFSGFQISTFTQDVVENGDEADGWSQKVYDLLLAYQSILESAISGESGLAGIIIDLRGNGGGNPMDFSVLWGPMLPENLSVGLTRIKTSDNRLSYSAWHKLDIEGISADGSDAIVHLPIALLVNPHSVSCSEISTMAFMAMAEEYGTDLRIIGGPTAGGNGPVGAVDILNAGTFSVEPYITEARCAGMELRYIDGRSFEGIGISPDIPVDFNYSLFMSGTDARLRTAFDFIRSR